MSAIIEIFGEIAGVGVTDAGVGIKIESNGQIIYLTGLDNGQCRLLAKFWEKRIILTVSEERP